MREKQKLLLDQVSYIFAEFYATQRGKAHALKAYIKLKNLINNSVFRGKPAVLILLLSNRVETRIPGS